MIFNRNSFIYVFFAVMCSSQVNAQTHELISFGTRDGGEIEAAFFQASDHKAVIFAHGAIFNKESWYFLAKEFQREGISALSVDFRGYGNSKAGSSSKKMYDILGAISYLNQQGFTEINIVGASMGGAAVLLALSDNSIPIHKVVLLAPAGGPAIESTITDKLFVVSASEGLLNRVMEIYNQSAEPKQVQVYDGNVHAQHLFKTDLRDELVERIMKFISTEAP